jgi:WD40 repeat protein
VPALAHKHCRENPRHACESCRTPPCPLASFALCLPSCLNPSRSSKKSPPLRFRQTARRSSSVGRSRPSWRTPPRVMSYTLRSDGAVWAARYAPDGRSRGRWRPARRVEREDRQGAAQAHDARHRWANFRFTCDGKCAATSSWEKDVRLWDLGSGRELGGFTMKKSVVNGVALSPDAKVIACGGSDGFVRLFDPSPARCTRPSPARDGST